jgi:hypothetical protein
MVPSIDHDIEADNFAVRLWWTRRTTMTLDEALADIESRGRANCVGHPASQEGATCADTQQAVRLLAGAYDRLLKRDALYRGHHRVGCLAPPPASVLPG